MLHRHRVGVVRRAARVAMLAYAYLRGRPYRMVERDKDWSETLRYKASLIRDGYAWEKTTMTGFGVQLLASLHAEVKRFGGDPGGVDAWLTPQP